MVRGVLSLFRKSKGAPIFPRCPFLSRRFVFLGVFRQIDKDGNVKRTASTFRNTVGPSDPVHKPGAWSRSSAEIRNNISPADPVYKPGAFLTSSSIEI